MVLLGSGRQQNLLSDLLLQRYRLGHVVARALWLIAAFCCDDLGASLVMPGYMNAIRYTRHVVQT
jgi:hypothetical protein